MFCYHSRLPFLRAGCVIKQKQLKKTQGPENGVSINKPDAEREGFGEMVA